MEIQKNIFLNNETKIDTNTIIDKCIKIHRDALINGVINITFRNSNISIDIKEGVLIDSSVNIAIDNSSIVLEKNTHIKHNSFISCKDSTFTINRNSKIGLNCIFELEQSELKTGTDCMFGDFTKVVSNKGKIGIGNKCRIGDYCYISSSPGNILLGDSIKIDNQNEIIATGNITIGSKSHFWNGVYVAAFEQPFNFLGRITLGQKSIVAGRGKIEICDGTMIGGLTYIVTESHNCEEPFKSIRNQDFTISGIMIEGQSWISAKCTILDGVNIGYRTVIGAGTLINKNIPPYKLAFGVPVKIIRDRRDNYLTYLKDEALGSHIMSVPGHYEKWLQSCSQHDVDFLFKRINESDSPISLDISDKVRNRIITIKPEKEI